FVGPCWSEQFAMLIKGGTVYDGTGGAGRRVDVVLTGERISRVGNLKNATASKTMGATGLAVAPGSINMLSWSTESLIQDGRSQSDIRQGVTLEIFGEGESMGPLNSAMKKEMLDQQGDIKFAVEWTTLGE